MAAGGGSGRAPDAAAAAPQAARTGPGRARSRPSSLPEPVPLPF